MQVLDTVGWVGDDDNTDFFLAIERAFDLRLRCNLPWTTFGEVRDMSSPMLQLMVGAAQHAPRR